MSTPSAFSKHAQLIKKCYPSVPEEKGPRSSDLAYLVFYATSRPEKLVKVGAFLEKQTRSDLYHLHYEHVMVTLRILGTLIRECHKDISLFSSNLLIILDQSLSVTNQPALTRTATSTFIRMCECPDAHAALSLDTSLHSTFAALLDRFASYANIRGKESPEDPTQHMCGIKALVAASRGSLSSPDPRTLLRRGIPALLANIPQSQLPSKDAAHASTSGISLAPGDGSLFADPAKGIDASLPPLILDPHCLETDSRSEEYLGILAAHAFAHILAESATVGVKLIVFSAFRYLEESNGWADPKRSLGLLSLILDVTRPANRFIAVTEILSQLSAISPLPSEAPAQDATTTTATNVKASVLISTLHHLLIQRMSYVGVSALEITDALRPWISHEAIATECLFLIATQRTYFLQGADVLSHILNGTPTPPPPGDSAACVLPPSPVGSSAEENGMTASSSSTTTAILSLVRRILLGNRVGITPKDLSPIIPFMSPSLPPATRIAALAAISTYTTPLPPSPSGTCASSSSPSPGFVFSAEADADFTRADIPFRSSLLSHIYALRDASHPDTSSGAKEAIHIWRILSSLLHRFCEESLIETFPLINSVLRDASGKTYSAHGPAIAIAWISLAGELGSLPAWSKLATPLLASSLTEGPEGDLPSLSSPIPPTLTGEVLVAFITDPATSPPWASQYVDLPSLMLLPPGQEAHLLSRPQPPPSHHPIALRKREGITMRDSSGIRSSRNFEALTAAFSIPTISSLGLSSSSDASGLPLSKDGSGDPSSTRVDQLREALAAQVLHNGSVSEMSGGGNEDDAAAAAMWTPTVIVNGPKKDRTANAAEVDDILNSIISNEDPSIGNASLVRSPAALI